MRVLASLAVPASKVLARLHRWYRCARVLAAVPLRDLDATSIGRLRYALMMSNRTRQECTQNLLRLLISQTRASAELNLELAAMATAVDLPGLAASQLSFAWQSATKAETADAATKLLRLNGAETLGTLITTLQDRVADAALQAAGQVTLVPVSGQYLQLWELWLEQVRRHVCRHVVAMAMDDAAYEALSGRDNITVVDVREYFSWSNGRLHPHTRGVLWYLRVLLLQTLVQAGHRVLVLDLDAIPVGDVEAMLSDLPYADVVAQKDHSIPKDVDRQLGFVLCCGFMLWHPTAAALHLLKRFASETAMECDDQLALNHLLVRAGIQKQQPEHANVLHFQSMGVRIVCPDETLVSRSLTAGSVVRHFHQTGQSIAEIRDALGL